MPSKVKKTLYTTETLFNEVKKRLEISGMMPDLIDYANSASWSAVPIKTSEWDVTGTVSYGGNEGIYLDLKLEGDLGGGRDGSFRFGTIKTLEQGREAFRKMHLLCADFILETDDYVKEHGKDFTWEGYSVEFIKDDKKPTSWSIWCMTKENVLKNMERYYERTPVDYMIVTDHEKCLQENYYKYDVVFTRKDRENGQILDTVFCPADKINDAALDRLLQNEAFIGKKSDWKLDSYLGNPIAMEASRSSGKGIDIEKDDNAIVNENPIPGNELAAYQTAPGETYEKQHTAR